MLAISLVLSGLTIASFPVSGRGGLINEVALPFRSAFQAVVLLGAIERCTPRKAPVSIISTTFYLAQRHVKALRIDLT